MFSETISLFVQVVKVLALIASLAFVYCSIGIFIEFFSNRAVSFFRKNTSTYIINRKFMLIEIVLILGLYLFNKGINNHLSLHLEMLMLFVSYLMVKTGEISIYPVASKKLNLKEKPFTKKDLMNYVIALLIATIIISVGMANSIISIITGIVLLIVAQTYKQTLLSVYH